MGSSSMRDTLSRETVRTASDNGSHPVRTPEPRARPGWGRGRPGDEDEDRARQEIVDDEEQRDAAEFAAVVDATGWSRKRVALELGIQQSVLSDVLQGKNNRRVQMKWVRRLVRLSPTAARVAVGLLGAHADPPFDLPRVKPSLSRAEADRLIVAAAQEAIVIWKMLRERAAEKAGRSIEEIEAAYVTDPADPTAGRAP